MLYEKTYIYVKLPAIDVVTALKVLPQIVLLKADFVILCDGAGGDAKPSSSHTGSFHHA